MEKKHSGPLFRRTSVKRRRVGRLPLVAAPPWPAYEKALHPLLSQPHPTRIYHPSSPSTPTLLGPRWCTVLPNCAVYEFAPTAGWKPALAAFVAAGRRAQLNGSHFGPVGKNCGVIFVTKVSRAVFVSVAYIDTVATAGPTPLMHEKVFFSTMTVSGGWTCDAQPPPCEPIDVVLARCEDVPIIPTIGDPAADHIDVAWPSPGWLHTEHAVQVVRSPSHKTHHTVTRRAKICLPRPPLPAAAGSVGAGTPPAPTPERVVHRLWLCPPPGGGGAPGWGVRPGRVPAMLHNTVGCCERLSSITGVPWKLVPEGSTAGVVAEAMDFRVSGAEIGAANLARADIIRGLTTATRAVARAKTEGDCPICMEPLRVRTGRIRGRTPFFTTCSHVFCHQCIQAEIHHAGTFSCPTCRKPDPVLNRLQSAADYAAIRVDADRDYEHAKTAYKHGGGDWTRVVFATVSDVLAPQLMTPSLVKLVGRASAAITTPGVFGRTYSFISGTDLAVDAATIGARDYTTLWNERVAAELEPKALAHPEVQAFVGCGGTTTTSTTAIPKLPPCAAAVLPGGWAHKEATAGAPGTFLRANNIERWILSRVYRVLPATSCKDMEDLMGPSLTGKHHTNASAAAVKHFQAQWKRPDNKVRSCMSLAADNTWTLCVDAGTCSVKSGVQTPVSVAYDTA